MERDKFISIAREQVGNSFSQYCHWYGLEDEWCAIFVSWCEEEAGLGEKAFIHAAGAGSIPRASCRAGLGKFVLSTKGIQPGDLILFRYGGAYSDLYHSDHIGIVTGVTNREIYTVEGNTCGAAYWSTRVSSKVYSKTASTIHGYYHPCIFDVKKDVKKEDKEEMNFKKGDISDGTLALKSLLQVAQMLGLIKSKCDDKKGFGGGTEKAVKEVQRKYKLEVDGIAGVKTITALRNAIKNELKRRL